MHPILNRIFLQTFQSFRSILMTYFCTPKTPFSDLWKTAIQWLKGVVCGVLKQFQHAVFDIALISSFVFGIDILVGFDVIVGIFSKNDFESEVEEEVF